MKTADLHCHPSLKPYNAGLSTPEWKSIWEKLDNLRFLEGADFEVAKTNFLNKLRANWEIDGEIPLLSQSNVEALVKGNVRFIMLSLYPVEIGFCTPRNSLLTNIIKLLLIPGMQDHITGKLVQTIAGIHYERAEFISGKMKNYFPELVREYEYLTAQEKNNASSGKYKFKLVTDYTAMLNEIVRFSLKSKIILPR